MRLSELNPCALCGGPLRPKYAGGWYVLRVSLVMFTQAANEVLGLCQVYGGLRAIKIAEAMAPAADDAVMIAGEKDPELWQEVHVCMECYHEKLDAVARLMQQVAEQKKAAKKEENNNNNNEKSEPGDAVRSDSGELTDSAGA